MTDTPVPRPTSKLDAAKAFFGDLARPFSIIATSGAAAWATIDIAKRVTGFEGAALYIAAVYAGVATIYWGKAWENKETAKSSADVAVARAAAQPPLVVAVPEPTPDTGELPLSQRINL